MHKSFMTWLKSVTELCFKTYLNILSLMLKIFMTWLYTAYTQTGKGPLNQHTFKQKRKKGMP